MQELFILSLFQNIMNYFMVFHCFMVWLSPSFSSVAGPHSCSPPEITHPNRVPLVTPGNMQTPLCESASSALHDLSHTWFGDLPPACDSPQTWLAFCSGLHQPARFVLACVTLHQAATSTGRPAFSPQPRLRGRPWHQNSRLPQPFELWMRHLFTSGSYCRSTPGTCARSTRPSLMKDD